MLASKTGATRFSDKREAGVPLFPAALVSPIASTPSWCLSEKREKKKRARSACYSCTDRRNKKQTAVINIKKDKRIYVYHSNLFSVSSSA